MENRVKEIVAEVLATKVEEREGVIARLCMGNAQLAAEVREMLAAHESAERHGFLAQPETKPPEPDEGVEGQLIAGRYKLLEQIGHGGMGVVWMAEQRVPVRRLVAMKLVKAGMDSKSVISRFEAERQALAVMDHPNIARVLDGGTTEAGRPWFAMELVRGIPLTQYCDERSMTVKDRLGLFIGICSAVQHAHQKGIIHRDLKPSNVLVTEHDGKPVPKVIDFGLAKALGGGGVLTNETLYTAFGAAAGTPLYMAPEQVAINAIDVDTRADIYALGVILYELLTGTTPLERRRLKDAAWDEIRRVIREEEPPRPSMRVTSSPTLASLAATRQTEPARLSGLLKGDLDWIVLKTLEKDRNRRYETANALAADVGRHLADEPVLARPASWGYRSRKFVRKHRRVVMAGSAVGFALVLGTGVASWGMFEARKQATVARTATTREAARAEEAEMEAYCCNISLAQTALANFRYPEARELLDRCPERLRGWEWSFLKKGASAVETVLPIEDVYSVAFSPDGTKLLTASYTSGTAQLWDVTGKPLGEPMMTHLNTWSAKFSPDGTKVLTSSAGGDRGNVQLWDLQGKPIVERITSPWDSSGMGRPYSGLFSPDGTKVLTLSPYHKQAQFWDLTGKPIGEPMKVDGTINSTEFSPDGSKVLTVSEHVTRLWDMTGKPVGEPMKQISRAIFSPDGTKVMTVSLDHIARLYDLAGRSIGEQMKLGGNVIDVAFSPDGTKVLTSSDDDVTQLWDLMGKPIGEPIKHVEPPCFAKFSPDGTKLVTVTEDHSAQLWDLKGKQIGEPMTHVGVDRMDEVLPRFSPDGTRLLTNWGGAVRVWDDHGRLRGELTTLWPVMGLTSMDCVLWSSTEDRIAIVIAGRVALSRGDDVDGTLSLFDQDEDEREVEVALVMGGGGGKSIKARDLAESPDGSRIAVADGRAVRIREMKGGRELAVFRTPTEVSSVTFAPDGARLVVRLADKSVQIWDARSTAERRKEWAVRYDERPAAKAYVTGLLAGDVPTDGLAEVMRKDVGITPLRRVVAMEVLKDEVARIEREADKAFEEIKKREMVPAKVLAAADAAELPKRVKEKVRKLAANWKPDGEELKRLMGAATRGSSGPSTRP